MLVNKQNSLIAYILIGVGVFFLLRELKLPIFTNFYSWQTILIVIGIAFLIHSYRGKNYEQIFTGVLLLGIGIHLHGIQNYSFWIDHWGMYLLILGLAFLLRYFKTKNGLLMALLFIGVGALLVFSSQFNTYFYWINDLFRLAEKFWPILIIIFGIILLRKK
ncbi:LiaI-LiaF-like domain-containing protein [Oceanobacillus sp. CAU 1775]